MRLAWRPIGQRLIAVVFALTGLITPALAGQSAVDLNLSPNFTPPADTGKPAIGRPPLAEPGPGEAGRCAPPLPCGTRLLGKVQKDGTVEVQVPALRW